MGQARFSAASSPRTSWNKPERTALAAGWSAGWRRRIPPWGAVANDRELPLALRGASLPAAIQALAELAWPGGEDLAEGLCALAAQDPLLAQPTRNALEVHRRPDPRRRGSAGLVHQSARLGQPYRPGFRGDPVAQGADCRIGGPGGGPRVKIGDHQHPGVHGIRPALRRERLVGD